MALPLPQLGRRTRVVLKYIGFVLLALVTFVFALQLTFPYDRVKDRIEEALSSKYDVTIGSVERGIMPGRVYFKAVSLRTRVSSPTDTPSTIYIEQLEVDLGIFALIKSTASVKFDAKVATGHLRGKISINKAGTSIDIEGADLPAASLAMKEVIGLPMSGKLELEASLDLPNADGKNGGRGPDWTKAEGEINFECPSGCTFGDGKTKLKPKLTNARNAAFAGEGIEFGKINVDTLAAHVSVKDGKLDLTKFEAKSGDGELHIDFGLTLAASFDDSTVDGCLRFKGSDDLMKREPKTGAALTTTGASIGPDGLFHIKLEGDMKHMRRLAKFCGPSVKSANMDNPGAGGNSRPTITVQPADDTLRGGGGTNPPPPPAPTPAPPPADAAVTPPPSGPVNEGNGGPGSAGASNTERPPGERELPEGRGTAGAGGAGSAGSGSIDQPSR